MTEVSEKGGGVSDSFDMMAHYERALEAEDLEFDSAEDVTSDEDGPDSEESGELSAEPEDASTDEDLDYDDEDLEEDLYEEDDDWAGPEDEDDPGDLHEEDDPEGQEPPTEDPQVSQLQAQIQAMGEQMQQMQLLLQQGQTEPEPPQQQQPQHLDPQLLQAIELKLFGSQSDAPAWEALPEGVRSQASSFLSGPHRQHMARAAVDPQYRYETEIRPYVEAAISQILKPIQDDLQARQNDSLTAPYEDQFKADPGLHDDVADYIARLPGAASATMEQKKVLLQMAVAACSAQRKEAVLAKEKQKVRAKDKQIRANKAARRGGSRGGKRSSRKTSPKKPRMREGESLVDYAERLSRSLGS